MLRMSLILYLSVLSLWLLQAHATIFSCITCCCQSEDEDCQSDPAQQQAQPPPPPGPLPDANTKWVQCNARPPSGQKWACEADDLEFPTVDCLVEDIKTCDVLNKNGANTVFYSFGVGTKDARPNVRDRLHPQGVMFNDGLMSDADWWQKVVANPKFDIGNPTRASDSSKNNFNMNRNDVFVARYSEALARASINDVYMVYGQEVGAGGKDGDLGGIYQLPRPIDPKNPDPVRRLPNAWRTWEFPTIQSDTPVKHIYGVDMSKGYPLTNIEWTRGTGQKELPASYASQLELPPTGTGNSAKFRALRRDSSSVCAASSSSKPTSTKSAAPGSITSAPASTKTAKAPSCTYVAPEPPEINEAFCTCDGKSSLPLTTLKTNAPVTASCAYTAQPTGSAASNPNKPPTPTTFKNSCQVCTPYAANEADCTSMPNCTPVPTPKGAATVEAGSSAVNVGTLTSDALYTSVSKALESLCPPVTQTTEFTSCATEVASIGGITYVADESLLTDGEFVVSVKSSQYNQTSLRDALIQSAATAAKFSTSEKNSYVADYTVEELRRRWLDVPENLFRRAIGLKPRDHPYPVQEHMTLYRAIDFAGAHYYSPWINANNIATGTDYIDVDFSFQAGSGADLVCDFIQDVVDALAVVAPEFAVEDIELGEAIGFLCDDASAQKRDVKPYGPPYAPRPTRRQSWKN